MDTTTLQSIHHNFVLELRHAAEKRASSLPFIINELPRAPLISDTTPFQVISIGGSVSKQALLKKTGNACIITAINKQTQPPFPTKDTLFSFLASLIDPAISTIALNFAYPMQPEIRYNRLDGRLLTGSKENAFAGLLGHNVGEEFERYMENTHGKRIIVAVANDTICLLLSGLTISSWQFLVAGIVGTGVNFALFTDPLHAVNLESANFDKFPISPETEVIDKASSQQKKALFEKETAGAYLYQHYNLIAQRESLIPHSLSSTYELKRLALSTPSPSQTVAYSLIEKSASLVAAQIAGIATYKQHPITLVMEGSFYWGGTIYRDLVDQYLSILLAHHQISILHIPQSTILGAARLVA